MAQYKVYRLVGGDLVVDLQSDIVATTTRIVAPLIPRQSSPSPLRTVEPVVDFDGSPHVLHTALVAAVLETILTDQVGDLRAQEYTILRAIDMVFTGI
jgi:toxin CcdB